MIEETVNGEITAMSFQGNEVRLIMRDGEPWFCCVDCCKALNKRNASDVHKMLDDEDVVCIDFVYGGKTRKNNFVSESGLYTLIMRSNSPLAKPFQRWVTHDVLPSIRKTGAYAMPGTGAARYDGMLKNAASIEFGQLKFRIAQMIYNEAD